ncbi:MAG TPA: hypothetical protein VGL97_05590 [Bryobacteraceae bacterium]
MSTPSQIAANQANSQHSTGPKTEEGKAVSSQNGTSHGLCGHFTVLPWENENEFNSFCCHLLAELSPATRLERDLVESMAQHRWLVKRALFLQNQCFALDSFHCDQEKKLALYLRYQTTNERAYYKALHEFQKLKEQRRKAEIGFASQTRETERETRRQERHELQKKRANLANIFAEAELENQLILNIANYWTEISKDPVKDAKFREAAARYSLQTAA